MTLARRAIAAAVVIVATGCDGAAPPQLELGTVATEQVAGPAGGELARVEVANVGGRALVLDGIRVDCGCRLVSTLPETLAYDLFQRTCAQRYATNFSLYQVYNRAASFQALGSLP